MLTDKHKLFLLFAIFIVLIVLFYPQYYLISDEHLYARAAHLLGNEQTLKVTDYLHSGIFHETNGTYSSKYPIGFPLLMAPFSIFGIDGLFLVNIILHLLASYCFYLILRRRKINELYTAFYLFFPLFAYYSVSLFADFTATSLLMIFYYLMTASQWKRRGIMLGAILTVIMYTRPVVLMFVLPFYALWLFNLLRGNPTQKSIKQSLYVFIPFMLLFAVFSLIPIMLGYNTGDPAGNTLWIIDNPEPFKNFFQNIYYQLELLLLVYPLMVLLLLNVKKQHVQGVILYIIFFGFVDYTANVTKFVGISSLVRHIRYVLPIIAILLPDYCFYLDKVLRRIKRGKYLLFAVIIFLIISSGALLFLHQKASQRNRVMMEDIYANTTHDDLIVSNTLAYFMYDSLGIRRYLGIDDYTETLQGIRTYTLGRNENMTSVEYLSSFIEQYPSYVVVTKGKYINDIPESQEKLRVLIDKYDGELVYNKEYGCSSCFGTVDTLQVEVYNLTSSGVTSLS